MYILINSSQRHFANNDKYKSITRIDFICVNACVHMYVTNICIPKCFLFHNSPKIEIGEMDNANIIMNKYEIGSVGHKPTENRNFVMIMYHKKQNPDFINLQHLKQMLFALHPPSAGWCGK